MNKISKNKVILCILDGYGAAEKSDFNAVTNAETPYLDKLFSTYPSSKLICSGPEVGLPEDTMGNSEVGHLNIGAGRVIYQDISRIDRSIKNGDFFNNQALNKIKKNRPVHLLGLVSDGNVHSSFDHLKAIIDYFETNNFTESYIHVITDGRDTPPESAIVYVSELEEYLLNKNAKIASVSGRYYTMDRDNRWDRVKRSYDMLTSPIGNNDVTASEIIRRSYKNKITDEFILPEPVIEDGKYVAKINPGDSVLFFNFRSDRAREITLALNDMDGPEFETKDLNLNYFTMTQYREDFKFDSLFPKMHHKNILGKIISDQGLKQLRIAETEKYAHVTFFFNGGDDKVFSGEDRILIPSPKVATYDLKPEMSAYDVTEKLYEAISNNTYSLIVVNYANCDMVGHTGDYNAAVKAVEAVDKCIGRIYNSAQENSYIMIVTADHGNSEKMKENGIPFTAHTKNKVPILITDDKLELKDGKLGDIAPTILKLLDIKIPYEMTGKLLF